MFRISAAPPATRPQKPARCLAAAVAVLAGLLAAPVPAAANVSLKNGNFFIGYTDVVYPGGFEPKIERVYNSKTPFKGIFGWGWGMEYEVYLTVGGDGSVIAHEYGGGAENRFIAPELQGAMLDMAIEEISQASLRLGSVRRENLATYRRRLRDDIVFRGDEWTRLVTGRAVTPRRIAAGTELHSSRFGSQAIVRTANGYQRRFDNGRLESFDDNGHLVRVTDLNQNFVSLAYDAQGRLSTITDNFGRSIRITFNARGLVSAVQDDRGRRATFQYNDRDELVDTRDVDGNHYRHQYDAAGRHNMTAILYDDATTLQVEYYPRAQHENVKSVKDRDGSRATYAYTSSADELTMTVMVTEYAPGGERVSSSTYVYELWPPAVRETSASDTRRMTVVIDGDTTVNEYSAKCDAPLRIARGREFTRFEYDDACHVTLKETPTHLDSLWYSPTLGKVTRVVGVDKPGGERRASDFTYDERGNLLAASNGQGARVELKYDENGRIIEMKSGEDVISFVYNRNSKPVEIRHSTLGAITVTYDDNGEITNVESAGGREVALRVTQAFQQLLDLIRPAGVSLSF